MNFIELHTTDEVADHIKALNKKGVEVVCDLETTDKNPRKAKLVDIQLEGLEHDSAVIFPGAYLDQLLGLKVPLVFHNMKYDLTVAYLHGVDLRAMRIYDTMLLHHLVDENVSHKLDTIVQERWQDDYKTQFWKRFEKYTDADRYSQIDYSCKDIVYTRRFYDELRTRLHTEEIPQSLQDQVHALALALLDTEIHGVRVDLPFTIEMGAQLKGDIADLERSLRTLGGIACENIEMNLWSKKIDQAWTPTGTKWKTLPKPDFNFASSAQVKALLYEELKLTPQYKWNRQTRKETLTTEAKALEEIQDEHPIVPQLLKYNKAATMYETFVEGVLLRAEGDRIYPEFNVNGTVTGRISHSNPNMGNLPSKGDWVRIRGMFIPDEGQKLITCDYGQLEVCIAAHFSQDPNLLKIIYEGASKHDLTAEGVGLPRGVAKTLNFAMQYQCSSSKVQKIVGCSKKDAELIWNKYWETYAGEKRVIDECKAKVDRGEPIVNLFGRKRRFPTKFANEGAKNAAYRQAYSSLIQGTGSDCMSAAFARIAPEVKRRGWGRAWFTVHDEALAVAWSNCVENYRQYVSSTMRDVGTDINLRVPLSVDCSEGLDRWEK